MKSDHEAHVAGVKKLAQEIVLREDIEVAVTGTSMYDHQSSFAAPVVLGCTGR